MTYTSAQTKGALEDRVDFRPSFFPSGFCNVGVGITNDYLFAKKVGAAVVAARRDDSTNVFDAINKFFLINQMIVPETSSWNAGFCSQPGDVANDQESIEAMKVLGQNTAWITKRIVITP